MKTLDETKRQSFYAKHNTGIILGDYYYNAILLIIITELQFDYKHGVDFTIELSQDKTA